MHSHSILIPFSGLESMVGSGPGPLCADLRVWSLRAVESRPKGTEEAAAERTFCVQSLLALTVRQAT